MIGKKAEAVLNRALALAVEQKHEFLTLEHVMVSLMEELEVQQVVEHCKGDVKKFKTDLESYLAKEVPLAPENEKGDQENPIATLGVQRLVQRALFQVQSSGQDEIRPVDLLIALFQAKDSWALYLLNQQGIDRLDVVSFVSHGEIASDDSGSETIGVDGQNEAEGSRPGPNAQLKDALTLYATNLNTQAKENKLDPLVGRKTELDRIVQTLCRRRKNNPLLVGEAGVGKTALAEGLAQRIVDEEVPELLLNAEIFSLDLGSLLAGTKFRGDFEQRMKRVLQALEGKSKKGILPILFIDEIHSIVGAGSVNGGTVDAANLLKPMLARGEIRCFGSTTFSEYRTVFGKDQALSRRFQKIEVPEPTQDETIQILNGLKPQFEEHHHVMYSPEAIKTAVELSVKHLTDRFLPDKAIDVIDEVGAKTRIAQSKLGNDSSNSDAAKIESLDVEEMIAQMARIPAKTVSSNQKDRLASLDKNLKLTIFGQNEAIEQAVSSIRLARSGLRSGEKPIGSFLFCGPTGVGKTELSKQLAKHLGVAFLRFDMSEYMEQHTVSRLIGAPPGYVGFDQAGLLTDSVNKNPHSVVLLDEVEKAHPSVWNILLQVMDHGFLTDNNGKKADFRNTILIMTSNVGSRDSERRSVGFSSDFGGTGAAQKELERVFSPEFRNRLDSIVFFNPLDLQMMEQVVGKQVVELEHLLLAKDIDVDFSDEAREWLAKKGFDRKMGARPLSRVIQNEVKRPLSEEILFGKLENGGQVQIIVKDDKLQFVIESCAGKKSPRKKKVREPVSE